MPNAVPYATIIVTAIATVGVGQAIINIIEYVKKANERKFSALYAALFYEQYADQCSRWLGEKEAYNDSDGHHGIDHGSMPDLPPFPSEIEWKNLGIRFTEDSFALRVTVNAADTNIRYLAEFDPPDGGDYELRNELVNFGLNSLSLASRLRGAARLQARHDPHPEYTTLRYLTERRTHYDALKIKACEAQEKSRLATVATHEARNAAEIAGKTS